MVGMEMGTWCWVMEVLIGASQKLIDHSEARNMHSLTFISANLFSPYLFLHSGTVPVMRPSANRSQIILSSLVQPWELSEAEGGSCPELR